MDRKEKRDGAAKNRDRAVGAGALLAGGGVAYGAVRGSNAISKASDTITKEVESTGKAVRQNARRVARKAGAVADSPKAPFRWMAKAMRKKRKMGLSDRRRTTEFWATEVRPGVVNIDGQDIAVAKLDKILEAKKVREVPFSKVRGINRKKGFSPERMQGVMRNADKPGIITADGTLVDGRHRSRMRKALGEKTGVYRTASKKDLKAAAIHLRAQRKTTDLEEKKPTREEKLNKGLAHALPVARAAGGGAVIGGVTAGIPGAIAGGAGAGAAQHYAAKAGKKLNDKGQPIRANIASTAIPAAALTAAGFALNTRKGKKFIRKHITKPTRRPRARARLAKRKFMRDTKAGQKTGRFIERMKNLEARLDSVNFSLEDQPRTHRGHFVQPRRVRHGIEKSYTINPGYREDATPGSQASKKLLPDRKHPMEHQEIRRSIVREAKGVNKWAGRGGRLASDTKDVITGKPRKKDAAGRKKKREWEKSWFRNAAATAGTGAAIVLGDAYLRKNPRLRRKVYGVGKVMKKKGVKAVTDIAQAAEKRFSTDQKTVDFRAFRKDEVTHFDDVPIRDASGRQVFRATDVRGNSARIFQGDKPKRVRRPKRWHEKVENERKLYQAGIGSALVGGVLIGANKKRLANSIGKMAKSKTARRVAESKVGRGVGRAANKITPGAWKTRAGMVRKMRAMRKDDSIGLN